MKGPLSNIVSVYPRPKDVSPISYLLCDFLYDFVYLKKIEIASERKRDHEREKESKKGEEREKQESREPQAGPIPGP